MNRMVCLLYKGYLKEILDYGLEPDEIEGKVQEFKRDVEVIVGIYASDTLGHDSVWQMPDRKTSETI